LKIKRFTAEDAESAEERGENQNLFCSGNILRNQMKLSVFSGFLRATPRSPRTPR
jgi:hypothetical protein